MRMPDEPKVKTRSADRSVRATEICGPDSGVLRSAGELTAANTLPHERSNDEAPSPAGAAWTLHGNTLQGSIPS